MLPSFRLEVFDTPQPAPPESELQAVNSEELRLSAFEDGYKDGWEDATQAQLKDRTSVSADLARNLQQLDFSYHEAKSQVLGAIEPLVKELVDKVLPQAANDFFAQHVVGEVMSALHQASDLPIEVVVAPANLAAVETLFAEKTISVAGLSEEASLADGQAYLRLGTSEKEINLQDVLAQASAAVQGFFEENQRETVNE